MELRPSLLITIMADHIESHTTKLLSLCLGIQYSEKDSSCKRHVVWNRRRMELVGLIQRETKTTLQIMLLLIEIAIHNRFRSQLESL